MGACSPRRTATRRPPWKKWALPTRKSFSNIHTYMIIRRFPPSRRTVWEDHSVPPPPCLLLPPETSGTPSTKNAFCHASGGGGGGGNGDGRGMALLLVIVPHASTGTRDTGTAAYIYLCRFSHIHDLTFPPRAITEDPSSNQDPRHALIYIYIYSIVFTSRIWP